MSRRLFTYSQQQYVIRNRCKKMINEMADYLGCARCTVRRFMKSIGIELSKKERYELQAQRLGKKTTATKSDDSFIQKNYLTIPVKTIASKLQRSHTFVSTRIKKLGLVIPKAIIEERKKESRFKAGRASYNKGLRQREFMSRSAIERTKATRFKKGNQPHNTKYDGAVSIRPYTCRNGRVIFYQMIRVSKAQWKMLHVKVWEDANGPLDKDHFIVFKNKNPMDCRLSNLKMVTRAQHMRNNTIHRYPSELKSLIRLNSKLKRKIRHATK